MKLPKSNEQLQRFGYISNTNWQPQTRNSWDTLYWLHRVFSFVRQILLVLVLYLIYFCTNYTHSVEEKFKVGFPFCFFILIYLFYFLIDFDLRIWTFNFNYFDEMHAYIGHPFIRVAKVDRLIQYDFMNSHAIWLHCG